jgi:predicted amidohydrolase
VAACQILTYPDIERSLAKVQRWMEEAAGEGVDILVFPEACLCGYASTSRYWVEAAPSDFQEAEEAVATVARELDIAVVLGTAHKEGEAWYNSLLAINRDGEIKGRYAKTHLAETWSTPGKRLPIYELAGIASCFLVCHDIRYPELVRLPAIAGAQICYFCSCESGLTAEAKLSAYRAMPISRAAENTIYLVMANTPANPADMMSPSQSHGNSKVIDPQGNVLDEAGYFEERLVKTEIDPAEATRAMANRAVEDDSLLQGWLRDGAKLVTRIS